MESILDSIKKLLGAECDNSFDDDICIHINSVFLNLNQIGVDTNGVIVNDSTAKWTDFLPENKIQAVKTFVYLKVRLLFDPPSSSAAIDSVRELIKEYEWRINVAAETED